MCVIYECGYVDVWMGHYYGMSVAEILVWFLLIPCNVFVISNTNWVRKPNTLEQARDSVGQSVASGYVLCGTSQVRAPSYPLLFIRTIDLVMYEFTVFLIPSSSPYSKELFTSHLLISLGEHYLYRFYFVFDVEHLYERKHVYTSLKKYVNKIWQSNSK